MDFLGGSHGRTHACKLNLDFQSGDLGMRQGFLHQVLVTPRRIDIRLAASLHERTAEFIEDQWTPVQSYQTSVVEVDQESTRGRAEKSVGICNNWNH
jgi:hypothetical protein